MKAGYKEALAVGTRWGNPPACSPGAAPPGKPPRSCHSPEALLRGYMPGEHRPGSSPGNLPCPYLNRLEQRLRCNWLDTYLEEMMNQQPAHSREMRIENAFQDASQNAVGPGASVNMDAAPADLAGPAGPAQKLPTLDSFVISGSFHNAHNNAVGQGAQVSAGSPAWPDLSAVSPGQPGPYPASVEPRPFADNSPGITPGIILFSQQDRPWLERLRTHLALLEQQRLVALWDDSQVTAGVNWQEAIAHALLHARFALVLVSAHALASPPLVSYKLPLILQRCAQGQVTLLPLLLSSCLYEQSPLGMYQPCNPDQPLAQLSFADQEEALANVGRTIYQLLA